MLALRLAHPHRWRAVLLAFLLLTFAATDCAANWWNLGFLSWKASHRLDQTLILSAQPTCSSIAGLSPKQALFCQKYFSLMPAVTYGARLGMQECMSQFKVHRWNCATFKSGVAFGPVSDETTKEASFAHAVSSAGVVHAVSRACKRAAQDGPGPAASPLHGQCGCSRALRPRSLHRDWIWGGCGDDVMFGYRFAKSFVDLKEVERNHPRKSPQLARTRANLHNNEVGRRLVFLSAEVGCKCHGVSGSCSLRTCWQQLRPFAQVGQQLKLLYESAVPVRLNRKGTDIRRRGRRRPRKPGQMELVFLHASPDYCSANATLGVVGTQSRECVVAEPGGHGPNSCRSLCCNRGYESRVERRVHRCHCKFEWCCQVKCRECEEEKLVHVCK